LLPARGDRRPGGRRRRRAGPGPRVVRRGDLDAGVLVGGAVHPRRRRHRRSWLRGLGVSPDDPEPADEWLEEMVTRWVETYKKSMTTLVLLRIIAETAPASAATIGIELT